MTTEFKYIAIAPINDEMADVIRMYAAHVEAVLCRTSPPATFEKPYVTFHPPIRTTNLIRLLGAVEGPTRTATVSRMRFIGLDLFGRADHRFVTLPLTVPLGASGLWWELNRNIMIHKDFVHGAYDYDNTLHTTLAKDIDEVVARRAQSFLRKIYIEPADIVIDCIEVHRKPVTAGGTWELVERYPLLPAL